MTRPGWLNKQFDFVINVEGIDFSDKKTPRTNPTHDDIFTDLENKKTKAPESYKKLYALIKQIYHCKRKKSEYQDIKFSTGYPADSTFYGDKVVFY